MTFSIFNSFKKYFTSEEPKKDTTSSSVTGVLQTEKGPKVVNKEDERPSKAPKIKGLYSQLIEAPLPSRSLPLSNPEISLPNAGVAATSKKTEEASRPLSSHEPVKNELVNLMPPPPPRLKKTQKDLPANLSEKPIDFLQSPAQKTTRKRKNAQEFDGQAEQKKQSPDKNLLPPTILPPWAQQSPYPNLEAAPLWPTYYKPDPVPSPGMQGPYPNYQPHLSDPNLSERPFLPTDERPIQNPYLVPLGNRPSPWMNFQYPAGTQPMNPFLPFPPTFQEKARAPELEKRTETLRTRLKSEMVSYEVAGLFNMNLEEVGYENLLYVEEIVSVVKELRDFPEKYKGYFSKNGNQIIDAKRIGLARSVQFDPNGDIWILLNRKKRGDKIRGEGSYKRVSGALNLHQMKVVARAVFKKDKGDAAATQVEIDFARLFQSDIPGLVQSYSVSFYKDKNGVAKTAVIQRDYDGDLKSVMRKLNDSDRLRVAVNILTGLKNMHNLNACHLDIKPDNILVHQDPHGRLKAALTDFNLGCMQGQIIGWRGSKKYMAPEMDWSRSGIDYVASPAMDIYSMYMTLREFIDEKKLSPETVAILDRMKSKDPLNRPQAEEVLTAFERELATHPDSISSIQHKVS